jgi:hypothetical protein
MSAFLLITASALSVASALSGGASCTSALDCQLNGACVSSACVCSPAWSGSDCSTLALLPAKLVNGFGHVGSNTSSWGAGVALDPVSGQYMMFNDEITQGCGLQTWGSNSHCVLSTSATPEGPYTRQAVVLSQWCHGSSVARDPLSGRWVFNHMSNAAPRATCTQCSSGVTPAGAATGPCTAPPGAAPYSPQALVADSPTGPYTLAPSFLNGGNCETFFQPSGAVLVACPYGVDRSADPACSKTAFLTVSSAPSLQAALAGQWTQLPLTLSTPAGGAVCVNWEDQNIWVDAQGHLHTLMHAWRGQNTSYPLPGCFDSGGNGKFLPEGCTSLGGHAYSEDGAHWYISPVPAYTARVEYQDGSAVLYRARERPHLITSSKGDPLYLVSAVGDPGPGYNTGVPGQDHSFTLVQGIATQ